MSLCGLNDPSFTSELQKRFLVKSVPRFWLSSPTLSLSNFCFCARDEANTQLLELDSKEATFKVEMCQVSLDGHLSGKAAVVRVVTRVPATGKWTGRVKLFTIAINCHRLFFSKGAAPLSKL